MYASSNIFLRLSKLAKRVKSRKCRRPRISNGPLIDLNILSNPVNHDDPLQNSQNSQNSLNLFTRSTVSSPEYVNLTKATHQAQSNYSTFSNHSFTDISTKSEPTNQYDSVYTLSSNKTPQHLQEVMDLAGALRELATSLGQNGTFNQTFSGKVDEDIDAFLSKFDRFCDINYRDKAYKLQTFPLLLDGRAYTLYQELPDEIQQDYTTLTANMKQYFATTVLPPLHAFETLYSQKMANTETVQQFFENILKKSKNLNITLEQKTALFISGLPKKIKTYVINEKPDTLAEALQKAKEGELLKLDDTEEATLIKTLLTKLNTTSTPKVSVVDPNKAKAEKCSWCNQIGHTMSQCFSYKRHMEEQRPHPFTKKRS